MPTGFQVDNIPNLSDYVAIVTGGNSGIGYETALQLALHHARVYIAGRSRERVEAAMAKINGSSKITLDLHFLEMDLQSLQSVKAAAEEFMKRESQLDLLINNAGVMAVPYKLTADGFETQWQINYLAPHLLFITLLPILQSTAAKSPDKSRVRVVNVASDILSIAPKEIEYSNVNMPHARGPPTAAWKRYAHSKIALIIQTRAIHNHHHARGISSFALHPGIVPTNLQSADPSFFGKIIRVMVHWRLMPGSVSVDDGARTSLFCATSPEAVGNSGGFFLPFGKADGRVERWTGDEGAVERLWEESGKMLRGRGF